MTAIIYFYNLLFSCCMPIVFLRLWLKGKNNNQYRERWLERIGYIKKNIVTQNAILIHCVSLGEVRAAVPLINLLLQQGKKLVITNMTPSGSEHVQVLFGNKVSNLYLPFDVLWAIEPFLQHVQPRMVIIFETELWPSFIFALMKRRVPTLLFNARISPASFAHYLWLRPLVSWMLNSFTYVAAQSEPDFERLLELGSNPAKLYLVGNIKFDILEVKTSSVIEQVKTLQEQIGKRTVLVAASTHANEEELLLSAYNRLKVMDNSLLLILVPRHKERFQEVSRLLATQKYRYVLRSTQAPIEQDHQVLLGDTIGELAVFYQLAFCVFLGGSLVDIGGHNMLEALVYGVPVITGPMLYNFQEITRKLVQVEGLRVVDNIDRVVEVVGGWLQNKEVAQKIGSNGQQLIRANQGVTIKLAQIVNQFLK